MLLDDRVEAASELLTLPANVASFAPMAKTLWVGTRKGLFALRGNEGRRDWKLVGPQFLGHVIHHVVQDPRDPKVVLVAAKTGHLGPTVFRSSDRGRTWKEASQPPAFRKSDEGEALKAVDAVFWLTAGHASERGTWYAGTSPAGLFRSEDAGATWQPVAGFNDHPMNATWIVGQGSPIGPLLHSVRVDPRDARHLYLGVSSGGVFESTDAGADWRPLNAGCAADFMPDPDPQYGHDPHCVEVHPTLPDRLYQQNHCGIYRLDRPGQRWSRIGDAMPRRIGDIGFPIVLHPTDPDKAWVFPMDGTTVWPRTSVDGKPAVYATSNGGKSWRRLDRGLPRKQGWFTVLRQAMCADDEVKKLGLYFGTTSGEIWASRNEGSSWTCLARHLPQVFSVTWGKG